MTPAELRKLAAEEGINGAGEYCEWLEARLLAGYEVAAAAEGVLAELGVTEPGAGAENHEDPAGILLDHLYDTWNCWMRIWNNTPDAVMEPEGKV